MMKYNERVILLTALLITLIVIFTFNYLTETSTLRKMLLAKDTLDNKFVGMWDMEDQASSENIHRTLPKNIYQTLPDEAYQALPNKPLLTLPKNVCKTSIKSSADITVNEIFDNMQFTTENGNYKLVNYNLPTTINSDNKPKANDFLQIIVVPHSHNDPGWLQTLQSYYQEKTKNILSNAVKFLTANPEFRMIWTEIIFLDLFWKSSSDFEKSQFKTLVRNGQIEILSGGWVSVDEATTHYAAVIDQLIEGHQWIKDNLGVYVNTSWSIDPFGYSATLPYFWRKAGMKNMAILRVHGAVKEYMAKGKMFTFNWRQQWDRTGNYDIFCHVEPYMYANIFAGCGPSQSICRLLDFLKLPDLPLDDSQPVNHQKNFMEFANVIVEQYRSKANNYKQNVLLLPHGDDFRYDSENEWERQYKNMKRLMDFINSKPEFNINMKFGSVSEYFRFLDNANKADKYVNPVISGDFFTYSDSYNTYWSGYYTTRPFVKRNIRKLLELLITTESFTSLSLVLSQQKGFNDPAMTRTLRDLQTARRTHGLLQHHDAITGTSRRKVMADYERRIYETISTLYGVLSQSIYSILYRDKETSQSTMQPLFYQETQNDILRRRFLKIGSNGIDVTFVNSRTQTRHEVTSLFVNSTGILLSNENGDEIKFQISPFFERNNSFLSSVLFEIFFELQMPPLSIVTYTLKQRPSDVNKTYCTSEISIYSGEFQHSKDSIFQIEKKPAGSDAFVLKNDFFTARFCPDQGMLLDMCKRSKGKKCSKVKVEWMTYHSSPGDAYCFGQDVFKTEDELDKHQPLVIVVKGCIVSQVFIFHPKFDHIISIFHTTTEQAKWIQLENVVHMDGPKSKNSELMMVVTTDIVNKHSEFYTDANGYQLMRRKHRDNLPIGGNFYPMTTTAVIEDHDRRLTIHSTQSHGVGNVIPGELEIMIDRAPENPGKGLDEGVVESQIAQNKFILTVEEVSNDKTSDTDDVSIVSTLTSIQANDNLQSPIEVFTNEGDDPVTRLREVFLKHNFPCSTIISNWKTFFTPEFKFLWTGLTLHRRMYSCETDEQSCDDYSSLNLYDNFRNVKLKSIEGMSLTYLHEGVLNSTVIPQIGELESIKLNWT